jgi:hypothetical protein
MTEAAPLRRDIRGKDGVVNPHMGKRRRNKEPTPPVVIPEKKRKGKASLIKTKAHKEPTGRAKTAEPQTSKKMSTSVTTTSISKTTTSATANNAGPPRRSKRKAEDDEPEGGMAPKKAKKEQCSKSNYEAEEEKFLLEYVNEKFPDKASRKWKQIAAQYNAAHPSRAKTWQSLCAKYKYITTRDHPFGRPMFPTVVTTSSGTNLHTALVTCSTPRRRVAVSTLS